MCLIDSNSIENDTIRDDLKGKSFTIISKYICLGGMMSGNVIFLAGEYSFVDGRQDFDC